MSRRGTCGTCRFYTTDNGDGVCRRFPPQGIQQLLPAAAPDGMPSVRLVGAWPHIAPEETCGEWQMKEKR